MHIQDFFQNFLKLFLVGLHGDCTISLIAQYMSPLLGDKNLAVEQSIHTAYVWAIRSAERFVYIENERFIGSSYLFYGINGLNLSCERFF